MIRAIERRRVRTGRQEALRWRYGIGTGTGTMPLRLVPVFHRKEGLRLMTALNIQVRGMEELVVDLVGPADKCSRADSFARSVLATGRAA